ncbi:MAG TPA: hypothetical protein VF746_10830 [Longimicrobium sp.]|jgi:hypothetical protein
MRFVPRRRWPVLAALGVVLQLSCGNPVCACPPARTHAVAFGTVRSAAGAPVQGATVKASVFQSQCGEGFREPADAGVTSAVGEYELRFFSVSGPGTRCVRFVASRGAAGSDSVVVDQPAVEMRHERNDPARVRIDFVLP